MTTAIATQETAIIDQKTLEEYLFTSGAGDKIGPQQKALFFEMAKAFNLNPFKREVYLVPYYDKEAGKYTVSILTGYEVYIQRAEATGKLNGWHVKAVTEDGKTKAILTIYRKDWAHPFEHEVLMNEYNSGRNLWRNKPMTMLKKVAISQGFRMCFTELSGMPYTQDEMNEVTGGAEEIREPSSTKPAKRPQPTKTPAKNETPPPIETPPTKTTPNTVNTVEDAKKFVEKPIGVIEEDNDPLAPLIEAYRFPMRETELGTSLDFKYQYEENGDLFEYHVPLLKETKKGLKNRHTFVVTRIFPNNDNYKEVPLVRGFIAALSGEPRMSFWTRQHAQCYRNNYTKLQHGCGNATYQPSQEFSETFVNEPFIEFAKLIAKQCIDAVLENAKFLYGDERYSTKTIKELAKLYMEFFIPLPHEEDPLFNIMCQQRQSLSGGTKGMKGGTSLYEGKITKDQAESFLANTQFALSLKEQTINKIYAAGGWNEFALPNLTPQNENIIRPILASISKQMKERFQ